MNIRIAKESSLKVREMYIHVHVAHAASGSSSLMKERRRGERSI